MDRTALVLLLLCLPLVSLCAAPPVSRPEQWQKVDEALDKGLPKTALQYLPPIIESALEEKAYAEAIKAIGRKIAVEGTIQGNKPEEKIVRMQAEIANSKLPTEMKPMMEGILAHWYWQYFQQNRWRFLQRTQTAEAPGEDFTTWDLPRIFAEIDKHFTAALAAKQQLQRIPIAQYDALLEPGSVPDSYRPTLYDFLAHQALQFYCAGEQGLGRAQDAFDLRADSPIFAPVSDFIAWQVRTTDEQSPIVKAVRLYQDLLRFHQENDDRTALLDADLLRLQFGNNEAVGEEKNARYQAALQRLAEQAADHEISARVLHAQAGLLQQEGDLVGAHRLATLGRNRFPESAGGKLCYNLIQEIQAPSVQIATERVWNAPLPTADVRYRNLTKAYFRVVAYDWQALLKRPDSSPTSLPGDQQKRLLAKRPTLAWSVDLPKTTDYQERLEEIPAPQGLQPGFYFLLASHDPTFGDTNNQVTYTSFWVSDLALVMRTHRTESFLEGLVLDAIGGGPISGAAVQAWRYERRGWVRAGTSTSDEDGKFRVESSGRAQHVVLVRHGKQLLGTDNHYVRAHPRRSEPFTRVVLFTDRALYRPGQTVHYKGLCIRVDQEEDQYQVVAGHRLNVVFLDRNQKQIARRQHRSNDYGSFSGSFTAPRDRLMGRMSIRTIDPRASVQINVEEYKRPKFLVTIEAPEPAARLNAEVCVQGKASAYTGAAVDGAKVRWRVVREVRYPGWWYWRCWWRPPQPQESQEIAHGSAVTATDGTFLVRFLATPDPSVTPKDEPTFQYSVHADVTDTTGETRSAEKRVNLGYTALQASLSAADWQTNEKPVEVAIRTMTLDGEGQRAQGILKVYHLKQPEKVARARLGRRHPHYWGPRTETSPEPDPSNPNSWPLGELALERGFKTDTAGNTTQAFKLAAGPYRVLLETQDRFGKPVTAQLPLQVLDPGAKRLATNIPDLLAAPAWTLEPGQELVALWGSGYQQARAFVEVEHRGRLLQSYWTDPDCSQTLVTQPVSEGMRGGFTVRVTMVRENRAYLHSQRVDVPWTNKNLTVKWEHFTSKLQPGEKQTWTAIVTGPNAKQAVAEMVATLYDASLDAYTPHHWQKHFGVFRHDSSELSCSFENQLLHLSLIHGSWVTDRQAVRWTYREFPHEMIVNLWGRPHLRNKRVLEGSIGGVAPQPMMMSAPRAAVAQEYSMMEDMAGMGAMREPEGAPPARLATGRALAAKGKAAAEPPAPDLSQVSARQNLNETAFFFPHLVSNQDGEVKLVFTMPEALTQWRFMGFAHDQQLRAGYLEDKIVTAKDLMVQPNPPRFLREGDVLDFTVKVTNQSASRQTGTVRLTLADARTTESVDEALGNVKTDLPFDVPAAESRSYSWRLTVPDDMGFLTYKAVGSTGRLSDGEEGCLPVLSRRILVTESLPLPVRGPQTKTFELTRLLQSGKSKSLRSKSLTVQMVSQPAWYAVMALPYLMEYPHQCSEQIFNRLYANALGRHIAGSDPKIRRVFDQWKATPALDSPLTKNEDLKAVMLEETPWLRQAERESQARRDVGILFDNNRMSQEIARAQQQLSEMQLADGAWPWFPGGRGNDYITLYIATGFGRLRHLGVDMSVAPAVKALVHLDGWVDRIYRRILEQGHQDDDHLSSTIALYLYGRSFFLEDRPVGAAHREAVDYFLDQARKHWLKLGHRQSQAHLAIALRRFGDRQTPKAIMASIAERAVHDDELGMYWRDLERSWWWYRAPIETQAVMIEAFDEVMGDAHAVEACKVWLLKQKQTQDWKTTKATADAAYALLLRGANLLASDALVEVSLGGQAIKPEAVEAGTGYYEQRFLGPQIRPQLGRITVKKVDQGVSWGSVHWQYLEDMSKVQAYQGTPLTLKKALYIKENTTKGPVLTPVKGPLHVGDELVVRLELRVDRDMEYVHLKDQRGSGSEPTRVLSRYRFQDGLGYYESTRDTASHFFIDYLPKGVYVFEYSTRLVHQGRYQTGVAEIQCMYAPEFNSHSQSFTLDVQ